VQSGANIMSQNIQPSVTEQMTAELRYLHKIMQAIDILAEHPTMHVVAYGKIWRYADLLKTAVRYAQLAELHGFDTTAFKNWFDKDAALFSAHGIKQL
jgi:hypothetical protein